MKSFDEYYQQFIRHQIHQQLANGIEKLRKNLEKRSKNEVANERKIPITARKIWMQPYGKGGDKLKSFPDNQPLLGVQINGTNTTELDTQVFVDNGFNIGANSDHFIRIFSKKRGQFHVQSFITALAKAMADREYRFDLF